MYYTVVLNDASFLHDPKKSIRSAYRQHYDLLLACCLNPCLCLSEDGYIILLLLRQIIANLRISWAVSRDCVAEAFVGLCPVPLCINACRVANILSRSFDLIGAMIAVTLLNMTHMVRTKSNLACDATPTSVRRLLAYLGFGSGLARQVQTAVSRALPPAVGRFIVENCIFFARMTSPIGRSFLFCSQRYGIL